MKKTIKTLSLCVAFLMLLVSTSFSCFAANDYKYGDVNSDGIINSGDALVVLEYSVGSQNFSSSQIALADVNCDKAVNSTDALEILMYSTGENEVFLAALLKRNVVDPITATGKYTLVGTILSDGTSGDMPVTIANDGENFAIKFEYNENGTKVNIKVLKIDSKFYVSISTPILLFGTPVYDEIPEDKVESLCGSLSADITETTVYEGTRQLTENGVSYTVESYMDKNNSVADYYFNSSKELKKIATVSSEGKTSVIEVTSLKATVDSSMFNLGIKQDLSSMFDKI